MNNENINRGNRQKSQQDNDTDEVVVKKNRRSSDGADAVKRSADSENIAAQPTVEAEAVQPVKIQAQLDESDLDRETKLKIKAKVEEYVVQLEKRYRRDTDSALIKEKKSQFFQKLMDKELLDEARDIEDIRKEEHFTISTNLVLSLLILVVFTISALMVGDKIQGLSEKLFSFMINNFDWFYILISSSFIIYLIYMAFSRFGNVVLGDPGEKPEFSNISWYSMLFSAGMGVGLLFWGGAEPLRHFIKPPMGIARTAESARQAMVLTCFNWGLHGWAVYVMCALGVAYYGFRKRKKYLISSSVMDVFDNKAVNKWLKIFADLVSTLAIVFGMGASLGMGILQISSGLKYVYGIDAVNPTGQIIIAVIMTAAFIISATTGLKKGIKILSNVNMGVAVVLMAFIFFLGPRLFILKTFVDTTGQYLSQIVSLGFNVSPLQPDFRSWMGEWTLTYFTWWIAWAPFVGIFIARISKGRTIKELILGAMIVPTLFTILWFSIFGGTTIYNEIYRPDLAIGHMIENSLEDQNVAAALFALLKSYPGYKLVAGVAILLLFTFLVTSADSATFVISMMTTEGDLDPSLKMKVLWGVVLAVLTLTLLIGGGIKAFKAVVLTFAFPFSLVLILITISLNIRLGMQVKEKRI